MSNIKNIRGFSTLCLCLSLGYLLTQCDKEEEVVEARIELEESIYRVGSSEGVLRIQVQSARADWEARLSQPTSWLNIEKSPSNDSLFVHYVAQSKSQSRSTLIELRSDTVTLSLTVVQNGFNLSFIKSTTLEATGGGKKIKVNASDTDWTASVPESVDWITLEKNPSADSLIISYEPQKEAGITRRTSVGIQLGEAKKQLSVSQSAFFLRFDPEEAQLSASAGQREVGVIATAEWSYIKPSDAGWITQIERKSDGRGVVISFAEHSGATSRRNAITFRAAGVTKMLSVIQDSVVITFPEDNQVVSALAGSAAIEVSSTGPDWTFTSPSNAPWVTQIEQAEGALQLSYEANDAATSRSVDIPVHAGEVTKVLTFTQDQVQIHTDKSKYDVLHQAAQLLIDVSSTGSSWDAFELNDVDWITDVQRNGDKLSITYMEYGGSDDRQATIRIQSSGVSKDIILNQKFNPDLGPLEVRIDPGTRFDFPAEGGRRLVHIQIIGEGHEDVDWTVSPSDDRPVLQWINHTYKTHKIGSELLSLHMPANKGRLRSERTMIRFSRELLYNGSFMRDVSITLSQEGYLEASRPDQMPEELYNFLGGDTRLTVFRPKVIIARKGPHASNVTKEEVRDMITGYHMRSRKSSTSSTRGVYRW